MSILGGNFRWDKRDLEVLEDRTVLLKDLKPQFWKMRDGTLYCFHHPHIKIADCGVCPECQP